MQLDYAVPASKMANLSSDEFAGTVADTPQQKKYKAFHCRIVNDFDAINKEEASYEPIPIIRLVDQQMVQRNYDQIRKDVQDIIHAEISKMSDDPAMHHLMLAKK